MTVTYLVFAFGVGIIIGLLLKRQGVTRKGREWRVPTQADTDKIMSLFDSQDNITNNDVQELLDVSDATAERYLDRLEKKGLLTQHGNTGKYTYYTAKQV